MIEGVGLLLLISIIVRVMPSLVGTSIRIPQRVIELISIAVFVNMFVYCLFSEASKEALPTGLAFAVILILFRQNLLLTIFISTLAFVLSAHFLHW
jgi:branched-subunit amino acid transport protein AzlD